MKKVVLIAILFVTLGMSNVNAQTNNKFGYINSLELLSLMPGVQTADASLKKYATELESLYKNMLAEYQKKIQEYQTGVQGGQMTDAVRELKEKEIMDLEKRIGDFEQSIQGKIGKEEERLYAPLQEKAGKAVQEVAKQFGYTYIFESGYGSLLYAEESDNILPLVKTKLGI